MSHDAGHVSPAAHPAHDTHAPAAAVAPPFSPEEVAMLHSNDQKAARNIVVLMVTIFVMGLAGYIAVAAICS